MRAHLVLRPLSLFLLAAGCCSVQAQSSLEGRVIVRWKAEAPTVKARAVRERANHYEVMDVMQRRADALGQRSALRLHSGRALDGRTQVVFAQGLDSATLAKRLAQDPQVELVAIDHIRRHTAVPNDPIYANTGGGGPASGQWYLKPPPPGTGTASSINAETAWNRSTGATNIAVAVIDTGVRLDHPDLAGNLLPGYDMIGAGGSSATRIAVANDGDLHDADPSDPGDWVSAEDISGGSLGSGCTMNPDGNGVLDPSSWHGTRVAGLIGAIANNGIGMAGVSWTGKIVPIRALGKCGGFDSDILAAVNWAVGVNPPGITVTNANPVKVINMSLGSTGGCTGGTGTLYREAFATANARGAVVVVAAGNSAGEPVDMPGNCAGAIAVTGLRHVGSKVGFSSMGPEVAIAAPGGNCVNLSGACLYPMVSTTNSGTRGPSTNTYTFNGTSVGTSFATPLVAGTAALMFALNPDLTPTQVRDILRASARPFPSTGGGVAGEAPPPVCPAPIRGTEVLECYCTTTTCGAGMLDANAALAAVPVATAPPTVAISASTTTPTAGNSVSLSANATANGGRSVASYAWSLAAIGAALANFSGATNGSTATLATSGAGTVTVQLTVTDSAGVSSTTTLALTIAAAAPTPTPAPSPTPAPMPTSGGGGGASSPFWLGLLALATALLGPRRRGVTAPPPRP